MAHRLITYLIALVWFINGLFCKVLNLVPRHESIVARILGSDYSTLLTKLIGGSEILMSIWVVSRIAPRLSAVAQIALVATMNTIEFLLAPDLLLWGRFNALFAFLFILLVFLNEFVFRKLSHD
jgi:hypothetical protein